jgi:hypothetical protein
MTLDGGTNVGGMFFFNSQTGWVCSGRLETCINSKGQEVPTGRGIAFGYRAYGNAKGRDCSAYPESVHWPDWAGRPTVGISSIETGHGVSEEVMEFKSWLADNPSRRVADIALDATVAGCQGKLAQRYLQLLAADPVGGTAEEHTLHLAIFSYLTSQRLRCNCDSFGTQLQRQYPEVDDLVSKSPRLPFAEPSTGPKGGQPMGFNMLYVCFVLVTSL